MPRLTMKQLLKHIRFWLPTFVFLGAILCFFGWASYQLGLKTSALVIGVLLAVLGIPFLIQFLFENPWMTKRYPRVQSAIQSSIFFIGLLLLTGFLVTSCIRSLKSDKCLVDRNAYEQC